MLDPLLRRLRATGFGDPAGDHPGVALESWFWRVVAPGAGRVALLAATRCRDAAGRPWTALALATHDGRGARVAEAVVDGLAPEATDARAGALSVGVGEARLDVRLEDPFRWPGRLGGLGLAHLVPGLSQYWHPHLLGGRVTGSARIGRAAIPLDGGLIYGEKNWGRGGAPPAWWWGQAFLAEDVVVCFAGGVLEAGPLRVAQTAVAVRVGAEVLSLVAPTALVRMSVAPGRWELAARDGRVRVRVRAEAAGDPLVLPVPVPARRRTAPLSRQHQDGALWLEVRRDGRRLVAAGAPLAGLELGGRESVGPAGESLGDR